MIWPNGKKKLDFEEYLGDKYQGEWKKCKKHGQGEDLFINGSRYIGSYSEG